MFSFEIFSRIRLITLLTIFAQNSIQLHILHMNLIFGIHFLHMQFYQKVADTFEKNYLRPPRYNGPNPIFTIQIPTFPMLKTLSAFNLLSANDIIPDAVFKKVLAFLFAIACDPVTATPLAAVDLENAVGVACPYSSCLFLRIEAAFILHDAHIGTDEGATNTCALQCLHSIAFFENDRANWMLRHEVAAR